MIIGSANMDFDLKIKITDVNQAEEQELLEASETVCEVNFDLLSKFEERAEYVYPYDELSTVLAKINASSVENHVATRSFFASKKPKFLTDSSETWV